MPYEEAFDLFWKEVLESVEKTQFAKLTMAKTVGKPNLRNIFVRPVYSDGEFKVLLKLRYRSVETEDQEDELSLEEAFVVVKSHLKRSFASVLLFTTKKNIIFKVNKKGAGSMAESAPTFSKV